MLLLRTILCVVLVALSAAAQTAKPVPAKIATQIPGQNAILMGAAWYPEQWPESRWEEDLRMMEAADLKVVRIAEFAWSRADRFSNVSVRGSARLTNVLAAFA